jgi:hypothetical protein
MFSLFKKIFTTGVVTENYKAAYDEADIPHLSKAIF